MGFVKLYCTLLLLLTLIHAALFVNQSDVSTTFFLYFGVDMWALRCSVFQSENGFVDQLHNVPSTNAGDSVPISEPSRSLDRSQVTSKH